MFVLYNGDSVLCMVRAKVQETAYLNITMEHDRFSVTIGYAMMSLVQFESFLILLDLPNKAFSREDEKKWQL
jgi:hypothetical protein